MRIIFLLSLVFTFISESYYSQNNHLFDQEHALYVAAGYMKGKRIVCGIHVQSKDSTNVEIHVKVELLKDWIQVDSSEFDLFLDTSGHEFISLDGRRYEAIQYRSKDAKVRINFEKPRLFEYYTKDGSEKRSSWISTYAAVICSNQLKKYNRVLKVYFEK